MLTFVPLQPHWLAQLAAFQSEDPQLVRASINLLLAAFHGQPCGTIPDSVESIATLAHLTKTCVQDNLEVLVQGWTRRGATFNFDPMVQFSQRVSAEHGDALERLQHATLVAMAAPDLFNSELLTEQGQALGTQVGPALQRAAATYALAPTKIPKLLPNDAGLSAEMIQFLDKEGAHPDTHQAIWERFFDYHTSKGVKSASWPASFRHWFKNQKEFDRAVAQGTNSQTGALTQDKKASAIKFSLGGANAPSKAERAVQSTRSAFEAVRASVAAATHAKQDSDVATEHFGQSDALTQLAQQERNPPKKFSFKLARA